MIALFGSLIFSDGVFAWYGPSEFGNWNEICPAKSAWQVAGTNPTSWNNEILPAESTWQTVSSSGNSWSVEPKQSTEWDVLEGAQRSIKRCDDAN